LDWTVAVPNSSNVSNRNFCGHIEDIDKARRIRGEGIFPDSDFAAAKPHPLSQAGIIDQDAENLSPIR